MNDDDNHITTTDSSVAIPSTWRRRAGDRGPILALPKEAVLTAVSLNGIRRADSWTNPHAYHLSPAAEFLIGTPLIRYATPQTHAASASDHIHFTFRAGW